MWPVRASLVAPLVATNRRSYRPRSWLRKSRPSRTTRCVLGRAQKGGQVHARQQRIPDQPGHGGVQLHAGDVRRALRQAVQLDHVPTDAGEEHQDALRRVPHEERQRGMQGVGQEVGWLRRRVPGRDLHVADPVVLHDAPGWVAPVARCRSARGWCARGRSTAPAPPPSRCGRDRSARNATGSRRSGAPGTRSRGSPATPPRSTPPPRRPPPRAG